VLTIPSYRRNIERGIREGLAMTETVISRAAAVTRLRVVGLFSPILGWIFNLRTLSLVMLVAVWWFESRSHPIYFLPGPDKVFESFWEIAIASNDLWVAMSISLKSLLIGGILALSVGITLGVLMGAQQFVEHAFDMYVNALYVAPVSALTPLLVFWFGIDLAPRVAAVFIFSVPEVIITCYQGAKDTPRSYVEVARAFGATDRDIFRKVIIPHEIPFIITAMRLGLGRAIKGMVLAELLISSTGLGQLVDYYRAYFDTSSLMAVLISLMLLGVIGTELVRRFEIAAVPWRTTP
jgi:ABC-type nitrate/sulfonate/bicarbonate transport system permease component